MDATEAAALKTLGERELWGVDELPGEIDADLLRCLDAEGLVEARAVGMQNTKQYRGDPAQPKPVHGGWWSPLRNPERNGDWGAILAHRTRDACSHPDELRVTERGRAELARMRRGAEKPRRRKRKSPLAKQERPLTPKEVQTLEVVGRHKQNFAAAARELHRDPKTVRENYTRALEKSNRITGAKSRSVQASGLPTDRRGQETVQRHGG